MLSQRLIKNSEQLLLICLRKESGRSLKRQARDLVAQGGVDWRYFFELVKGGRVAVLVFDRLKCIASDLELSEEQLAQLKVGYLSMVSNAARQHQHLIELLNLFNQRNIPVLPLKGTLLAERLYGDISARGFSADFDLLVEEKNKEQGKALLAEAQFYLRPDDEIRQWQWSYTLQKAKAATVELHWDITMMGRSRQRLAGLWKGARLIEQENIRYYEFKEEELLIYLAAHLINSSRLRQLRYVCDIDRLLRKYKQNLDWNGIIDKARAWKLSGSVYATLSLSQDLLGSAVPQDVFRRLRPNIFSLMLVKVFVNRKVLLRNCFRKRLINSLLSYVLFELIEARTFFDYYAVAKRVLFPPRELLADPQGSGGRPLLVRHLVRLAKGGVNLLRKCFSL